MNVKELQQALELFREDAEVVVTWEGIFVDIKHNDISIEISSDGSKAKLIIDANEYPYK